MRSYFPIAAQPQPKHWVVKNYQMEVHKNALKGQSITAQGKAQRRPGLRISPRKQPPCKGKALPGIPLPLQGGRYFWGFVTQDCGEYALSWAVMLRPFRPNSYYCVSPHEEGLSFAMKRK